MPIDNYKMSIQAKPLYGSITKTDSEGGLVKIVRPLGRVRNPSQNKSRGPSVPQSTRISTESVISSETSDVGLPSDEEAMRRVNSDGAHSNDNIFLPQMSRSRNKVFENRYKIASRQSSEPVKPAKLYSKRVIYLPMFRVHVETYVGNSEDNKAVETTRQSLKRIIDNGKQLRVKSAKSMAPAGLKSYNFHTPGREGSSVLEPSTPRKLIHTDRSVLSTARSHRLEPSEYESETEYISKPGSNSDDADRMDVHLETLELNSIDDTGSIDHDNYSTISSRGKMSLGNTLNDIGSVSQKDRTVHSLSDPYRNSRNEFFTRNQKIGWPNFDDIKKMKQKIRWQKNAQRQMERESMNSASKPKTEVQRWVNIHYAKPKPILKYTSQTNPTRLDPIIVPSHTCTECPMCIQEVDQIGTSAPPNSPDNNSSPVESILSKSYKAPIDTNRNGSTDQFTMKSPIDQSSVKSPTDQPNTKSPSNQSTGKDSSLASRSNQSSRNEVFMIPKVTVKVLDSKAKLDEAKMAYTKSGS